MTRRYEEARSSNGTQENHTQYYCVWKSCVPFDYYNYYSMYNNPKKYHHCEIQQKKPTTMIESFCALEIFQYLFYLACEKSKLIQFTRFWCHCILLHLASCASFARSFRNFPNHAWA